MSQEDSPSSILDFLTHPNPTVHHLPPKSTSNTRNPDFYWPKELKKWDQFENLEILKSAFRGRLYGTVIQPPRTSLRYPYYKAEIDCRIRDEAKTRTLVDKWNHSIVTQALEEVDEFKPSYWVNGNSPVNIDKRHQASLPDCSAATREQPTRGCVAKTKRPRQLSRHRRIPDAGSIVLDGLSDGSADDNHVERFPKEYKPAGKWSSNMSIQQDLLGRGREPHQWRRFHIDKAQAWPIRQAFTYCVEHMCRYGCILTCQEAFIFQIQPLEQEPNNIQSPEQLRRALIEKGKMEYVSIPWTNFNLGRPRVSEIWTVNLALWFVHVLAGHSYEVAWTYDLREHERLGDTLHLRSPSQRADEDSGPLDVGEKVAVATDLDSEQSDVSISNKSTNSEDEESPVHQNLFRANGIQPSDGGPVTRSKKRKRDSDSPDSIEAWHFSFSKHRG